jgi:membrane-bound lytic murein transglycosylase D
VWAAERFVTNLANYDKPLTNWQTYNAKRGERMDNIAQKFGINVAQLRSVNGLSSSKKVRTAQPILVPANYTDKTDDQTGNSLILAETIDVAELEQNGVDDSEQKSEPKLSASLSHKVKRGDTLHSLADKYDISSNALMKINGLKSSKLKVGQIIKLSNSRVAAAKTKNSSSKKITVKHRIKSKKIKSRSIKARSNLRFR